MCTQRTHSGRTLGNTAVLVVLGLSAGATAQPPTSTLPALTLPQAIDYALNHNPALAAAREQVVQGSAARQTPVSRWLPRLGLGAEVLAATANNTSSVVVTSSPSLAIPRVGGTAYDPALTIDTRSSWQPYASTFVGVGISQQIFDFGLTAARIAAADATLLAERHDRDRSVLDTKLDVTVSFLAVQVAHAITTAAEAAVQRATAQRDQAAALVNSQLRSRIFLDRAQAELSRLRIGLLQAHAGLAAAESGLAASVGYDQSLLDVVGTPDTPSSTPDVDTATAAALSNDPALKAQAAQIQAQHEGANAIAALTRPSLYLTGTVSLRSGGAPSAGTTPQFAGALPETPNWDVGLLASWTFFDPVVLAEARAARAEENVLRANLEATRQRLVALVQTVWNNCSEAEQALPELQKAFEAAKENYAQATVRFGQGLGTSVEIADAETLLVDSEVQLAEGRFGFARGRAQLTRTMAGGLQ